MGKKRTGNNNQHASQSFGQMVSKAALTQMLPQIESMVNNLGRRLAAQQARTYEMLFSRIVVLEKIMMEKYGITEENLADRFADVEDERDSLVKADTVEQGDLVRLEISTKVNDQKDFQGTTKLKVPNIGKGDQLGTELETAALGMKVGETKEVKFGEKQELTAKLFVQRISRPIKAEEEETSQTTTETEAAEETAPVATAEPVQENADANNTAG